MRRRVIPTPLWCWPRRLVPWPDVPGARDLLSEALDVWQQRFFDDDAGMFVDSWNGAFTELDDYRGVNANMHGVEALLAAADVTGDHGLRASALGISRRVALEFAEPHSWRIPEHFDSGLATSARAQPRSSG